MLFVQLKEAKNFTPHEKEVAQYILQHPDQVVHMSANELAFASLTSKATVVRLGQKLGLSGFQEFKLKLIEELNQSQRISHILAQEPITDESSYEDILNTLPSLYDKAITNTKLTLKKSEILRIHHFLLHAQSIEIYGTGVSYYLAQAAAFKFATLGLEANAYESINTHFQAARKQKKTVCFLISFTGANRAICQMAQYLREATDNHVVGILGPHNEVTRKWCHEVVEIPNRDSILSLDVISSTAAVNYVMDIFFSLLLAKHQKELVNPSLAMQEHAHILLDKGENDR